MASACGRLILARHQDTSWRILQDDVVDGLPASGVNGRTQARYCS